MISSYFNFGLANFILSLIDIAKRTGYCPTNPIFLLYLLILQSCKGISLTLTSPKVGS